MKMQSVKVILVLVLALTLFAKFVNADPSNQTTLNALGGNMTQLTILGDAVDSDYWSGYYGNISGEIRLSDANNFSLYSWNGIATAEGEIYASDTTISDWSTVRCINLTLTYPGFNCTGQGEQCLNLTEIENNYGMSSTDPDGVNETFNETLPSIEVGTITLYNCPRTSLYSNSTPQQNPDWNETILTVNNSEAIIFAAIINPGTLGFDNKTWDFQMIVADNGGDAIPTTYYVYTELT